MNSTLSLAARFASTAALALALGACGSPQSSGPSPQDACSSGQTRCGADGLYTCANGAFELSSACTCAADPSPHCEAICSSGISAICQGDSIRNCGTGAVSSCNGGRCLMNAGSPVCATKAGDDQCVRSTASGDFALHCSDGDLISTSRACDLRTGKCQPVVFDCAQLTSIPADRIACDRSGSFLSRCENGQPQAVVCAAGTSCSSDGTAHCYTSTGKSCGGQAVCSPGLHCTQTAVNASTCVQPAGILACNATDVLAVCTDQDTGVACIQGAVYWWQNLTRWGGSCQSNHVTVPLGGNCIPGLADCTAGLACNKTAYDLAGVCAPPAPGAPPQCTLTAQASTGLSCDYSWGSCLDGKTYRISCLAQRIAGQVLTTCDCLVNGQKVSSFAGDAVCKVADLAALDATGAQKCGWQVKTVGVTGG